MQKTDLNVSPYYDDFDTTDNFHRVLFRPGFAVQARELTQLQSILQNQIEKFGTHMFKEGSMVIPGQTGFTNEYYAVKLQPTFNSNTVSTYVNDYIGKTITGATSGVKATVIGFTAATTTDPLTLYVKYTQTGTDNVTTTFANNEEIQANGVVNNAVAGTSTAQLQSTSATATGSAANIEEGVYFVRGQFVRVTAQRVVLDKYTNTPSYRVGLSITENLITPEEDSDLLDNAQGSSNVNAKGAHRLKVTLTLAKLPIGSAEDEDFIELLRVKNGRVQEKTRNTEYSVLGDTLARRTYDESGDYSIRPFGVDIRESLDNGLNEGVYASGTNTDDGATTSESLMSLQVSPGKAYVRGYEIETSAPTFIDVAKPRTTENFTGAITPAEVGNFTRITDVYNSPDLSPFISGEMTDAYKEVELRDTATATRGAAAGTKIGVARARAFEHRSGNDGSSDAFLANASTRDSIFNLYLFDIRMYTQLTMSGTPSGGTTVGSKVTGQTSGATGFIHAASGTGISLITVSGSFNTGEKLISSSSTETDEILEDSGNTDLTISAVVGNSFDKVKQVFMDDPQSGEAFTADTELNAEFSLSGTISTTSSSATISGFGTKFLTELRAGDVVNISGVGDKIVQSVTDNDTVVLTANAGATVTTVPATRKRASLDDQNKNILIRKLRKNNIKTLKTDESGNVSRTSITVRKQFIVNSTSSGQLILTAGANETFSAKSNTDFVITVLDNNTSSACAQGDIINLNSSNVTAFNQIGTELTITNTTAFPIAGIKCKVVTTVTRTASDHIPKTAQFANVLLVANDGVGGGAQYGTSAHHKEISLGNADAYKLWAVLDSESTADDAVLPQFTYTGLSGSFTQGEVIVGATTGTTAIVVPGTSLLAYIVTNNKEFQAGEIVTGQTSSATATIDTLTDGSKDITSRFTLDTGQRDNFYDIARIVRKGNAVAPTGRLLVVYNYLEHGAGDFFTVDSYSSIDYKEIPTYTATRVDPEVREPTGEYDLRNSIDFRPRVADATFVTTSTASGTANAQGFGIKEVNSFTFDFNSRSFSGTGGHNVLIPKDNSNIGYDFDFYLGRVDNLFLTSNGDFKVVSGTPAEDPEPPKAIENSMKLAELTFPAYMLDIEDAKLTKEDNRRYTMRDIGRLEQRIENVEYYTALNLLEQEAQSLEILDANGLNRFKSGFVVDNFGGHRVGDVLHKDYQVAIDMENNLLRPKCVMRNVQLTEVATTDNARTSAGYQKTGDLITLPYTSSAFITQPYATRVENVQTYLIHEWVGKITLDPSGDEWFETEEVPALIINVEGNFNTIQAGLRNQGVLGTVWNNWQTQWSGVVARTTDTIRTFGLRETIVERTIETTRTDLQRTGVNTQVVERIEEESLGNKVISRAVIPFVRPRTLTVTGECFRPGIRLYAFFDGRDMSQYVTPSAEEYSDVTSPVEGSKLITDGAGKVEFSFRIPEYRFQGQESQPRFKSGELEFRLTSSSTNDKIPRPLSAGNQTYISSGVLETTQETIVATRNAEVVQTKVNQSTSITDTSTIASRVIGFADDDRDDGGPFGFDPLAQTFLVTETGGCFLTSLDLFFASKDNTLPVWVEVRNVVNGYPGQKLIPFGRKVLNPSDINLDANTGTSATTFTFDSPIFLQAGAEYCFVVMSNSLEYKVWISQMGEQDVSGTKRVISSQPHLGTLFKSQNNRTWDAVQSQDMKFTLRKAVFESTTSTVSMTNDNILEARTIEEGSSTPVYAERLLANPIVLTNSSTVVKVNHRDHGMYSTSNNVVITGVSSGVSTTVATNALTTTSSSLIIASATNFPSSGTVTVKIGNEILSGTISGTTLSSLTRGIGSSDAAAHAVGDTVELYMINSVPLTEINKTHTAIANIGIDSFTITVSTTPSVSGTSGVVEVGGTAVYASANYRFELMQSAISALELTDTTISSTVRTTSATSPSGSETSFATTTASNAEPFPLGENFQFETTRMVASQINETNELSGAKSFFVDLKLSTSNSNLSPVIDLDRASVNLIANRINNIDSSSDVFPTTDFNASTEPDGDQNVAVYLTRGIALENPATSIKVFFAAAKKSTSEIKVLFKTLGSDESKDFDEKGFTFFNDTGTTDSTVRNSLSDDDFQEYVFTAGVKDDGVGEQLSEFSQFQIKIVMQGTDAANPPLIKDLRVIALAT